MSTRTIVSSIQREPELLARSTIGQGGTPPIVARQDGKTPEDAARDAKLHLEGAR